MSSQQAMWQQCCSSSEVNVQHSNPLPSPNPSHSDSPTLRLTYSRTGTRTHSHTRSYPIHPHPRIVCWIVYSPELTSFQQKHAGRLQLVDALVQHRKDGASTATTSPKLCLCCSITSHFIKSRYIFRPD